MIKRDGLPDFIIGGAMKCGTSSMHSILSSREDIFMPEKEVHFFSMGDFIQSPEIINFKPERTSFDINSDEKVEWYRSFFEPARGNQLIGGYSTVYLPSQVAPERIRKALPDVKLIFMLRNPVDRTYSHYWHLVNTGRATKTFEQELIHGSSVLHLRSFYKRQLKRYFQFFPRDQTKVILFERFVKETQSVVDEVCAYLGLPNSVNLEEVQTHANPTWHPLWHRTYLLFNYALNGLVDRYRSYWPGEPSGDHISIGDTGTRLLRSLLSRLRRSIPKQKSYPPIDKSLRRRLTHLYARKNRGIGELVDTDIGKYWPFS